MKIFSQTLEAPSQFLSELKQILEAEWGQFEPFNQNKGGMQCPAPLVAVENQVLLGGLVFSLWKDASQKEYTLWINGVIVKPAFRGRGVASQLVKQAVMFASGTGHAFLYAKSEVAPLYLNNGWQVYEDLGRDKIFKHPLN